MTIKDEPEQSVARNGLPSLSALPVRVAERFRIDKPLGKGGSGAVFQAWDEARQSPVALKFLTALDPGAVFRFKSEFRTLANLVHPNLLQLHELLSYRDAWLLSMELVEGSDFLSYVRGIEQPPTPLDAWPAVQPEPGSVTTAEQATRVLDAPAVTAVRTTPGSARPPRGTPVEHSDATGSECSYAGPVDYARLRAALRQLAEGLENLHQGNRLHRDLKPANVLVSKSDERVVICDFGLALEGRRRRSSDAASSRDPSAHTHLEGRSREVAGTLAYMSPEQARADVITPASDWYSVGVMLYQALTGRLPFNPRFSFSAALHAKLAITPLHPGELNRECPSDLAELAMGLLHVNPAERAGYSQLLAALDARSSRASLRVQADAALRQTRTFVGREPQLSQLAQAFAGTQRGEPHIALVSGISGMGKTSLVQHFLSRLEHESGALVLRARCYEREELPYKALDPLIDALTTYLLQLEPERALSLLPDSIAWLAALFPDLRRVPAIAERRASEADVGDPFERRRLGFRAFRELCERLSREQPLVLFIDDLQWGDLDSAPLFRELLALPHAPPVLLVCAYRSEDELRSPLVSWLRDLLARDTRMAPLLYVRVGALAHTDAKQLALSCLHGDESAEAASEFIATEAEGNPFFLRLLATYASEYGLAALRRVRLGGLIKQQLEELSPAARALLTLIALAGQPTQRAVVVQASGVGAAALTALRELAARQLIVSTRDQGEEHLECFHDRIREAACQQLDRAQTSAQHRALADALEAMQLVDSERLLRHWRDAGERERASGYALEGARHAENALAFKRAADLYREALELLAPGDTRERELRERLGHALMLSGRWPDAADVFLGLLPDAEPRQALQYRMLATSQLLRGGKLQRGFAALRQTEDLLGLKLPDSLPHALWMLMVRRLRLLAARRRIRLVPDAREDAARDTRLTALWEVAAAVASADFLRGTIYGAELLLEAIKVGDPAHLAGACGLEAINAAADNQHGRVQELLELAQRAAQLSGRPELKGRALGMQAICRQLQGRWSDAVKAGGDALPLLRGGERVNWDHTMVTWWELTAAAQAGMLAELAQRTPEALRDAEARGDVYGATSFRTHRLSWAWLSVDRPGDADAQVDIAEREWTPEGYQFQHWHMTYARSEIDLYRGTPQRAFDKLRRDWKRRHLVQLVRGVRTDMLYTRARLALALARRDYRASLLQLAAADARALVRQAEPWTVALGQLILACTTAFHDRASAVQQFAAAEAALRAVDMAAHVEAARARRGELLADAAGHDLTRHALERLAQLGAHEPERFADMLATTVAL